MNALRRATLRPRRLANENRAYLRRAPAIVALVLAVGLMAVLMVLTTQRSDWGDVLQGFASNIVAAAVLAGFAYFIFVFRFRKAKLPEYLSHFRRGAGAARAAPQDPLLRILVRSC